MVTGLWYTHDPNLGSLSWFWRCKEHPSPWGFGGHWNFPTGVWHLDLYFDMVTGLWYMQVPNFGSLSLFWRCKEPKCPLSPNLGLWRMLKVPDWGLASWSWFGYGHWSLIHPYFQFWISILILKAQRTSMSFKSSCGAWEDTGCSRLGFGILTLIWILPMVFNKANPAII